MPVYRHRPSRRDFARHHRPIATGRVSTPGQYYGYRARCLCDWIGGPREDLTATRDDLAEHLTQAWVEYLR